MPRWEGPNSPPASSSPTSAGYTSYSEARSTEEVAAHLNRFYAVATRVLTHNDAVINKLVGDEVMALWVPGFAGQDYIAKMVEGAEQLLRAVRFRL
jgi:adenylate cyclase